MSRSRRGGGAFGGGGGDVEVGQAERENDAMSAALSDRIATLKGITQGLHDESESQNRLLDGMDTSFGGVGGLLEASFARFKLVFDGKDSRRMVYTVSAIVAIGLLLWLAVR
eukprot:PRCOL_00006690-RA